MFGCFAIHNFLPFGASMNCVVVCVPYFVTASDSKRPILILHIQLFALNIKLP